MLLIRRRLLRYATMSPRHIFLRCHFAAYAIRRYIAATMATPLPPLRQAFFHASLIAAYVVLPLLPLMAVILPRY